MEKAQKSEKIWEICENLDSGFRQTLYLDHLSLSLSLSLSKSGKSVKILENLDSGIR